MIDFKERLNEINTRITDSAVKSGRNRDDITLIAVTKTVPTDIINQAIDCGIKEIGENRVQELTGKINELCDNIKLHFIGQLQSNKVKYIIDKVNLIHSVDRLSLAEEINNKSSIINQTMPILIEVNIGNEMTKSGLAPDKVKGFIDELSRFTNITVQGLMTVAPYNENKEFVRPYFQRMKELFESFKDFEREDFDMRYLSMGMSNDYEIAITEGANMVRLGTVLFGNRS